jgi:hypothetical protein
VLLSCEFKGSYCVRLKNVVLVQFVTEKQEISEVDLPWLPGTLLSVQNKFPTYIINNKQHISTSWNQQKMFHKLNHVSTLPPNDSPSHLFIQPHPHKMLDNPLTWGHRFTMSVALHTHFSIHCVQSSIMSVTAGKSKEHIK